MNRLKRWWACVVPIVWLNGLTMLFVMIFSILLFLIFPLDAMDVDSFTNDNLMYISFNAYLVMMPIMFAFYQKDVIKYGDDKVRGKLSLLDMVCAIVGLMGVALLLNIIISLTGIAEGDSTFNKVNEVFSGANLPMQMLYIVIAAPLMEELVVRGMIYTRIKKFYGVGIALMTSALIFGAMHGNITQGIYATLLGLCLAGIYELTADIWICFFMHAAANFGSLFISSDVGQELIRLQPDNMTMAVILLCGFGVVSVVHFINVFRKGRTS